jgi:PTS system N-acetylglucosamine-specific IIC component
MKNLIASLQPMGRALMLPIAVLPAAALLLRLGQPDLLNIAAMAAAGSAIFSNLGLLFAIGVAVGLARENHGAAGLASVVGYLVTTKGAEVLIGIPAEVTADLSGRAIDLATAAYRAKELAKLSVPAGLINGLLAGWLYNRYSNIRLPSYLAFFAGRRFVPIAAGVVGIVLALCFGYGFPVLERGMDAASQAVLASDSFGQFAYGVLNRVLIVTGLHHILNNMAWFLLGDYNGVTGDLNRFFAGVMMFGLPAACLAMYRSAPVGKRSAVAGLLFSMALTSFLTGVTEPIEFTFMFLAPVLYAIHAVLTGVAMAFMDAFDVRLGFGFSAGLFDYVLNFKQATRPWLLLPIGLVYFALYYGLFRFFIVRLDLKTPGREAEEAVASAATTPGAVGAAGWVQALGGARNLVSVDACTTRLRLVVANQASIDEGGLKKLGARGVVRPSAETLQVVVGPIADQLASDIRSELKAPTSEATPAISAGTLLEALGGRANIRDVKLSASRLCVAVKDADAVVESRIAALTVRGVARPARTSLHFVLGPSADALFQELNAIL